MGDQPQTAAARRAAIGGLLIVVLLACLFFGFVFWVQIAKWRSFHYACFDYSNVAGILEETANGHFRFQDPTHIYSQILAPIFLPYFLLYLLHRGPETLMAATAFFFATGIVMIYLAARRVFRDVWVPLLFSISLMLNPIYDVASLSGFRLAATVIPGAIGAFLAHRARRKGWFIACVALMCASQINIVPCVFVLGLAMWLADRDDRYARLTMIFSAVWFVATLAAVAIFSRATGIPFPAKITHFAAFGGSAGEIARTLFTRPGFVLSQLFYRQNLTLLLCFVPLLGLPLAGPVWLAAALPELGYIALSTYGHTQLDPRTSWATHLHDPWFSFFTTGFATIMPFVYLAAIPGAQRVGVWLSKRWTRLWRPTTRWIGITAFLLLTLFIHYEFTPGDYGPVPLTRHARFADIEVTAHDRLAREMLASLDRSKMYLMPDLYYFLAYDFPVRYQLRETEDFNRPFDYLIFDEKIPCPQMGDVVCRQKLQQALADPRFEVVRQMDGLYLLARKHP